MRRFKIFDTGLTENVHQNHVSKKNIYSSLEEIVKIFDYRNLEIYEMEVIDGRTSILPRVDKQLLSKVKMFL